MRTSRFINAGLAVAVVCAVIAAPAAAVPALDHGPGTGASAAHSAAAVYGASRPIPQPPTWPLHPKVIPPPANAPLATLVAHHSGSSFDWGAASIGAGTTLAVLAIVLATAFVIRRRRVGPPARLT